MNIEMKYATLAANFGLKSRCAGWWLDRRSLKDDGQSTKSRFRVRAANFRRISARKSEPSCKSWRRIVFGISSRIVEGAGEVEENARASVDSGFFFLLFECEYGVWRSQQPSCSNGGRIQILAPTLLRPIPAAVFKFTLWFGELADGDGREFAYCG
ncbi:hypothetical protein U1Q18_049207 [Sarracenia purpurea var. burkii]